jgi:hypothetical protein
MLDYLSQNKTLSTSELTQILSSKGIEVKPATLRWKLYALRKVNLINDISKGIYELNKNDKSEFTPDFSSNNLKKVAHKIQKEMPYLKFCVWTTSWLNQLMVHQPISNLRILEVEAKAESSVFSLLENNANDILINPSKEEIDKYLLGSNKLVIKPLINNAPINKGTVPTPKLEKILVDIFTEKELFYSLQGSELSNIFVNAIENYNFNLTTLLSYAKRRNKKEELLNYLKSNIKEKLNDSHRLALDRVAARS